MNTGINRDSEPGMDVAGGSHEVQNDSEGEYDHELASSKLNAIKL